jgi:hypothetical protein
MRTRLLAGLFTALVTFFTLVPAPALAVTHQEKLSVAVSWTQPTSASQSTWDGARKNPAPWVAYAFDWSTDHCSSSPDKPMGFDFRLSCHRHDFGYRNFKKLAAFDANKPRLDDAFYVDMKAVCAKYRAPARQSCLSIAWTYYQAVKKFGDLIVSQREVDRAAKAG